MLPKTCIIKEKLPTEEIFKESLYLPISISLPK